MNLRLGAACAATATSPRSSLNSCSGEPAARGEPPQPHMTEPEFVSIPVLVNLRLGARGGPRRARAGVRVSIPVLVNLRLGGSADERVGRLPPPVSIPVLVNLRLGAHHVGGRRVDPRSVSIPVLVNLRLGGRARLRRRGGRTSVGLNSCSGEPAARGLSAIDRLDKLLNTSQFLFW